MAYAPGWRTIADLTERLGDLEHALGEGRIVPARWEPNDCSRMLQGGYRADSASVGHEGDPAYTMSASPHKNSGRALIPVLMRGRALTLLLLLLFQTVVVGQPGPIYFVEHDWTFRVAGARFGLYQDRLLGDEKYGAGRHTTLYFGRGSFRTRTRTFQRSTWEVLSVAGAALCLLYLWTRGRECTKGNEGNEEAGATK